MARRFRAAPALFLAFAAALPGSVRAQTVVRIAPVAPPAALAGAVLLPSAASIFVPSQIPPLAAALLATPSVAAEPLPAAAVASPAAPRPAAALSPTNHGAAAIENPEPAAAALEAAGEDAAGTFDGSAEKLSFSAGSPLAEVRVQEVVPNVFHLRFPTQYMTTATFLRFQEHYESPKYRGKVFSLEEFMDWYAQAQGKGQFTYFTDWAGFNIPSKILRKFYEGEFDPLSRKEKDLLALFAGRKDPFYLIGTYGEDDAETLRHEIAHGLFTTRPDYRLKAKAILKDLKLKPIYKMLKELGYHWRSWLDEAHAYLGDDLDDMKKRGIDVEGPYADAHRKLLALYREYAGSRYLASKPAAPAAD